MSSIVKIIQPSGILDSINGNRLRREVSDVIEAGAKAVLIDCCEVEFMDSSGLGALVMSLKTVRDAGSKLSICSINDQLRILFELTSMDDIFEVFANQEEFNQAVLTV